ADHLLRGAAVDPTRRVVDEGPPAEGVRRPDELVRVFDQVAVPLLARADDRAGLLVFDGGIMRPRSGRRQADGSGRARRTQPAEKNAAGASAAATRTATQRRCPVSADTAAATPAATKSARSIEWRVPPYG